MARMPRFRDRREAGRRLAELLAELSLPSPLVLGIPRGGVVVADEVASALGAPLDVVVVRKLGYPGHEEAAFGAVGEGGVLAPASLAELTPETRGYDVVRRAIAARSEEVTERVERYRGGRKPVPIAGTSAIVVDDGIATGYTFAAALAIVAPDRPRRLISAIPVATVEGAELVERYCDEVRLLSAAEPGGFFAVSLHYDRFEQVSDEEVVALLGREPEL